MLFEIASFKELLYICPTLQSGNLIVFFFIMFFSHTVKRLVAYCYQELATVLTNHQLSGPLRFPGNFGSCNMIDMGLTSATDVRGKKCFFCSFHSIIVIIIDILL